MCGHDRLEVIAGADRHEAAGLSSEQLGDGPGVVSEQRNRGQDQGAGVDLLALEASRAVLRLDECPKRFAVKRVPVKASCRETVRFVKQLALHPHVTRTTP